MLAADWALFETLDHHIHDATAALADLLPKTPAGILLGVPGVGVLTASACGAAIGNPHRYRDAAAAYRASNLLPISYESAGRARTRTGITREGFELRRAIVDLGRGVGLHEPDFTTYRRHVIARGKPPLVALIAVRHRAHRLAFAKLRSQHPFDADRLGARRRRAPPPRGRAGPSRRYHRGCGPPERRDLPAESTLTYSEASSN